MLVGYHLIGVMRLVDRLVTKLHYTHEKTGIRYDAQILFTTFQVICQSVLVNNEVEHHYRELTRHPIIHSL